MSHREIDVDALDEDRFLEEEEEVPKVTVQEEQDQVTAKTNEVRSLLNK
jgi:hypothetical protein